MPDRLPLLQRRHLLGALASLPVLGRAGGASAVPPLPATPAQPAVPPRPATPPDATVLLAGPQGGPMDQWAHLLQPALAQSLAPGTAFRDSHVGGADGVTAANQFETRGTPDGLTLLMVPGATALAWLVGDPRAKFDVSRWMSVMAAITPAVLVGRPGTLTPGRPVRIAAATLGGPDLPAILGVELLGARAEPVSGLGEEGAIRAAFARNAFDAVLLRGHKVPEQFRAMTAIGAQPLFSLGVLDELGRPIRATEFPDVPLLGELYQTLRGNRLTGPLYSAWTAAAVASQLEFGLMLPALTPAPMVALWRRAGQEASAALDIQALAASLAVRPLSGPAATACGDLLSPRAPALLALRGWLAERFNWRPA